jgi:PAT family beta-lactamase induction signal transducer AmpG
VRREALRRNHPLAWVPTLYFAMGAPMVTVTVVAAIVYKNLGVSNIDIALYTGALYLPWTIKPLWAPIVEMFRTKRFFVLAMELALAVTLGALAFALSLPSWMPVTLALFWIVGLGSATQDIAADGVYIGSTTSREQALYVGVQGIAWNGGRILASGLLVSFTGALHELGYSWTHAWMVVMVILAGVMLVLCAWHARVLPDGDSSSDTPRTLRAALAIFARTFSTFFAKPRVWMMVAVVFSYRFGEGMIEKIAPLFLLDAPEQGGLGLSNAELGHIVGTFGTLGFIAGTLLGGALAARYGLRRAFVWLVLALDVPHVVYCYLAHARPSGFAAITAIVTIEKLGYGVGSVGHMLYMIQEVAPGPYRTAHYAFATGIMALSMMLTGMISGPLQAWLGYQQFFVVVLVASLPSIGFAISAPFGALADRRRMFA